MSPTASALAYEECGQGPTLVLLHAFPLSRTMWAEESERLAGSYRVIAPDLPGFGRSPRQARPSIPRMAEAVIRLLDELRVRDPAVVAGLSMGGYVAFEIVRQARPRVRALGLFSTRALADTPQQREQRAKSVDEIRAKGLPPFANATVPRLIGATTQTRKPELAGWLMGEILAADPTGVIDALRAMAERPDVADLLPSLACPTLVLHGDEDPLIPMDQANRMADQIPGARLERITPSGHLVNLEQPETFHAVWTRFLGACL